jgi:hypothetical protein
MLIQRPVFKALHQPQTIAGVEWRQFLGAVIFGVAAMNMIHVLAGVVMFGLCYAGARRLRHDPQMLPLLIRLWYQPVRYDASKHAPVEIDGWP